MATLRMRDAGGRGSAAPGDNSRARCRAGLRGPSPTQGIPSGGDSRHRRWGRGIRARSTLHGFAGGSGWHHPASSHGAADRTVSCASSTQSGISRMARSWFWKSMALTIYMSSTGRPTCVVSVRSLSPAVGYCGRPRTRFALRPDSSRQTSPLRVSPAELSDLSDL